MLKPWIENLNQEFTIKRLRKRLKATEKWADQYCKERDEARRRVADLEKEKY